MILKVEASIIVPTYNERENLAELVDRIAVVADVEIIVVDDASPDGTADLAQELSQRFNIKVVRRAGKLGLSSAILDGFNAASSDIVGVIDADLQHPPEVIPKLIEAIKGGAQVAFGSRKVPGGGVTDWPAWRKVVSWGAALLALPLTSIKDPMSGFFFIDKSIIKGMNLETIGFKLGLEIIVKCDYDTAVEIPFMFKPRTRGDSKLTGGEFTSYLRHLLRLYRYKIGL